MYNSILISFFFFFLTIKNGPYILTNFELSQAQDVPRRPQIITNMQCQSKISQVPNKPKDLTTTNGNQKQKERY